MENNYTSVRNGNSAEECLHALQVPSLHWATPLEVMQLMSDTTLGAPLSLAPRSLGTGEIVWTGDLTSTGAQSGPDCWLTPSDPRPTTSSHGTVESLTPLGHNHSALKVTDTNYVTFAYQLVCICHTPLRGNPKLAS